MELGALTCTKSSPQCARCPVAKSCYARAHNRTGELPRVLKKAPPQLRELVALLALDPTGTHVLLQRSAQGLFAGLWNLPMCEGQKRTAAHELAATLNLRGTLAKQPIATLEHLLTHRRLRLELYAFSLEKLTLSDPGQPALRLQARDRLGELGISSLTQKALAAIDGPAQLSLVE
jgi:A/G-specific adenine glycosylase